MTILRPKFIQYVNDDGSASKVQWAQSPDNPMSENYVPLTVRGERDKARWWALHGTNANKRQTHGIF